MSKKITVNQSNKFNDKISKILIANDFVKNDVGNGFEKITNFGKVTVNIYHQYGSEIWSIFCKFDDIQKASKIFNCNHFSGKYNFHRDMGQEKQTISDFEFFMQELNFEIDC